MTESLLCREATSGDLPQVLRLYAQPGFDDGDVLALDEAERILARMAAYPDYKLYVAEHGGNIVGTFALLVMDNLGHRGRPSAVIEDVAVAPECQRQGVGRRMMEHALTVCAAKGCYKAALSSNLARAQAHAFYEALSFERHGYSYRTEVRPQPLEQR